MNKLSYKTFTRSYFKSLVELRLNFQTLSQSNLIQFSLHCTCQKSFQYYIWSVILHVSLTYFLILVGCLFFPPTQSNLWLSLAIMEKKNVSVLGKKWCSPPPRLSSSPSAPAPTPPSSSSILNDFQVCPWVKLLAPILGMLGVCLHKHETKLGGGAHDVSTTSGGKITALKFWGWNR